MYKKSAQFFIWWSLRNGHWRERNFIMNLVIFDLFKCQCMAKFFFMLLKVKDFCSILFWRHLFKTFLKTFKSFSKNDFVFFGLSLINLMVFWVVGGCWFLLLNSYLWWGRKIINAKFKIKKYLTKLVSIRVEWFFLFSTYTERIPSDVLTKHYSSCDKLCFKKNLNIFKIDSIINFCR